MSENFCTYPGDREAVLVAYLYDEIDAAERKAFEAHLATCEACSNELTGLGATRARLDEWASPEPADPLPGRIAFPIVDRPAARWQDLPVWIQALAALLILSVSAGAANLHVTYNADGLAIRTGWLAPAAAVSPAAKPEAPAGATSEPAVTRAEMTSIAEQLRAEIRAATPAGPSTQQVRGLIADSERKQENELALRIASLYKDSQAQRTADLTKIQSYLSLVSNNSTLAVRQQNEYIRSIQARLAQK